MLKELQSFEDFKKSINEKKEDQEYSYGCLMGYFNQPLGNESIEKSDLYNNEDNEYGLEIEPHVTLLYGLHDDEINEDELITFLQMLNTPQVKAINVSLFENDDYDVVKYDIESNDLTVLNSIISKSFPNTQSFPDYHPHSTIAYCLKGSAKKYEKDFEEPIVQKVDYWVYSKANGKKIKIVTGQEPEIIRQEKTDDVQNEEIIELQESVEYNNNFIVEYNGYEIRLAPHNKIKNSYGVGVYLNDLYKSGIRGYSTYDKCIDFGKTYINNINNYGTCTK